MTNAGSHAKTILDTRGSQSRKGRMQSRQLPPRQRRTKWPRSLQLPGGRIVEVRAREPASDGGARPSCLFAEARALFEGGELALYEGDVAVEAASLSLAEFRMVLPLEGPPPVSEMPPGSG